MPGADVVHQPWFLRICYAMPGTETAYSLYVIARYAMSGTDMAYQVGDINALSGEEMGAGVVASCLWSYAITMPCPVLTYGMRLLGHVG
eukprot:3393804-Rhodomonas_salina.2